LDRLAFSPGNNVLSEQRWQEIDVDSLTLKNPNFWKAYYEVAPGQGVMEALYGGLLKAQGECTRSLQVSVIARLGRRPEGSLASYHVTNAMGNQAVLSAANYRIGQGIELFEEEKFEQAAAAFKEILREWPQCGLASFELGLTIHHEKEQEAGRKVETQRLKKGDPRRPTQESYDLYATARKFDPMIRNAYQGEASANLVMMAKIVLPAYRSLADFSNKSISGKQLAQFGAGSQAVGLHDYALFARQIHIASKNKFDPPDLEFIRKSLEAVIDIKSVDQIADRLSTSEVEMFSFKIGDMKK